MIPSDFALNELIPSSLLVWRRSRQIDISPLWVAKLVSTLSPPLPSEDYPKLCYPPHRGGLQGGSLDEVLLRVSLGRRAYPPRTKVLA